MYECSMHNVRVFKPSKFLLDTIFARGMTVLDSKKMILPEIKLEHNLDVPLDRYGMLVYMYSSMGVSTLFHRCSDDNLTQVWCRKPAEYCFIHCRAHM